MSARSSSIHPSSCGCALCVEERDIVLGYRLHNTSRPYEEQWEWCVLVQLDGQWSIWEVFDISDGPRKLAERFKQATCGGKIDVLLVPSGAIMPARTLASE